MNCVRWKEERKLGLIVEELKNNVNKNTFLTLILEAIDEFKKSEYQNKEARDFFYNIIFEAIFSIEVDNSYVLGYIYYFKSNVPFNLERFEAVVKNIKLEID